MSDSRKAVVLGTGEGRSYPMERNGAVFKADGAETEQRHAISKWWKGDRPVRDNLAKLAAESMDAYQS